MFTSIRILITTLLAAIFGVGTPVAQTPEEPAPRGVILAAPAMPQPPALPVRVETTHALARQGLLAARAGEGRLHVLVVCPKPG